MVTGVKVGPHTTMKDFCDIILLAYLPTLLQCNSDYKLLFDCGTGASRFMFNINHIGDRIGLERCQRLLFVYSLTLPHVSLVLVSSSSLICTQVIRLQKKILRYSKT